MKHQTPSAARSTSGISYVSNPATYNAQASLATNSTQSMGYAPSVAQSAGGYYVSTSNATRDAYRDLNKSMASY